MLLSVCMCVSAYPPNVARQQLGKSPVIVARQRLGFLCGPRRIKGKNAIHSSQNFLICIKKRLKQLYVYFGLLGCDIE
jgi:hypothetical protein